MDCVSPDEALLLSYNDLTLSGIKKLCRHRGISPMGKRVVLVERLSAPIRGYSGGRLPLEILYVICCFEPVLAVAFSSTSTTVRRMALPLVASVKRKSLITRIHYLTKLYRVLPHCRGNTLIDIISKDITALDPLFKTTWRNDPEIAGFMASMDPELISTLDTTIISTLCFQVTLFAHRVSQTFMYLTNIHIHDEALLVAAKHNGSSINHYAHRLTNELILAAISQNKNTINRQFGIIHAYLDTLDREDYIRLTTQIKAVLDAKDSLFMFPEAWNAFPDVSRYKYILRDDRIIQVID